MHQPVLLFDRPRLASIVTHLPTCALLLSPPSNHPLPPCAGMKLVREATEAAETKKEKEKEAGEWCRWQRRSSLPS